MARSVALLRGINVGGKNLIKMADLKACFESAGFGGVTTYIQSGNVVFDAKTSSSASLTARLEALLAKAFNYQARVTLRSGRQLDAVVREAPKGFGQKPALYRSDVLFLMEDVDPAEALAVVPRREGVDQAFAGPGVLYFSRLISKASQSRLSKLVSLPLYQQVTIRNWNTTTKLRELVNA